MTVLVLSVLAVTILILIVWLATVQREQTQFLRNQLSLSEQRNLELLNRLMSRDPMTYATLSQVTTPSQTFAPEPYIGMTDAQEAERWAHLNAGGIGETIYPEDLTELGLKDDNA